MNVYSPLLLAGLLGCGSAWQLLELAPGTFQQRSSAGLTAALDITQLDALTASYNTSFYVLDSANSAFVQLSTSSIYTPAEQLGDVVCFRVDARGFHSLELRNGGFQLVWRYFNGSVASSASSAVQSVVYGRCALHLGALNFISLNGVHTSVGVQVQMPFEVLDIAEENGWLQALLYDSRNRRFLLYNGSTTQLGELEIYDRFVGAELETPGALGSIGATGPYPIFDLLYGGSIGVGSSSAVGTLTSSGLLSTPLTTSTAATTTPTPVASSTPIATTTTTMPGPQQSQSQVVILNSFSVVDYSGQVLQNLELSQGSVTFYDTSLPTFGVAGNLVIGADSVLTLDISNIEVVDGTTLTLFTFGSLSGSFDEIRIEGWDRSCEQVYARPTTSDAELRVTLQVIPNELCNDAGTGLLMAATPILYFLL